jgi:hypothetical protein
VFSEFEEGSLWKRQRRSPKADGAGGTAPCSMPSLRWYEPDQVRRVSGLHPAISARFALPWHPSYIESTSIPPCRKRTTGRALESAHARPYTASSIPKGRGRMGRSERMGAGFRV